MTMRIKDVEVDYETDLEVSETIAEMRQEIKETRNVYSIINLQFMLPQCTQAHWIRSLLLLRLTRKRQWKELFVTITMPLVPVQDQRTLRATGMFLTSVFANQKIIPVNC